MAREVRVQASGQIGTVIGEAPGAVRVRFEPGGFGLWYWDEEIDEVTPL